MRIQDEFLDHLAFVRNGMLFLKIQFRFAEQIQRIPVLRRDSVPRVFFHHPSERGNDKRTNADDKLPVTGKTPKVRVFERGP